MVGSSAMAHMSRMAALTFSWVLFFFHSEREKAWLLSVLLENNAHWHWLHLCINSTLEACLVCAHMPPSPSTTINNSFYGNPMACRWSGRAPAGSLVLAAWLFSVTLKGLYLNVAMQDKYACKANDGIVTEGLMSDTLWSTSLTGKPRLLTPTRTQNDEVSPLKRKGKKSWSNWMFVCCPWWLMMWMNG